MAGWMRVGKGLSILAVLLSIAAVGQAADWSTYVNPRFGTAIDYPADLFVPLPPPDNDDGRSFAARTGSAGFIVYASHNVFGDTLATLLAADAAGSFDHVTYRREGDGWYVLSGYRGGAIVYRKVLLSEDAGTIHAFEMTYPAAQSTFYDPIVAEMAASLRADEPVPAPAGE